jgi:hypothetical protein
MLLTAYASQGILLTNWIVEFHDEFDPELEDLAADVQDELYAQLAVLKLFGRAHLQKLSKEEQAAKHSGKRTQKAKKGKGAKKK